MTTPMIPLPANVSEELCQTLLGHLGEVHRLGANRECLSTVALKVAFAGSRDYSKAVSAALSTLGEVHGPIKAAGDVLAGVIPPHPGKIPGWGSGFIKKRPDPSVEKVIDTASTFPGYEWVRGYVDNITTNLHLKNKPVFPNPALATAITSRVLGVPTDLSPHLFIQLRLPHWYAILSKFP